jgi:hypothetical protein
LLYALANESSTNPFKISSHANTNNKNSGNVLTTAKHSKNFAQTNQATTNTNTNTTTTDTTAISASNNYVRRLSMPPAATAAPLTTLTTTSVSRIPQPIAHHLNADTNNSRKHSLNQFYENSNTNDEDALQNKYEYVEFYDEEDDGEEEHRVNGNEENEEKRPLQDNEDGDYDNDEERDEGEEDYSQRNNTSQGYREPLLHLRN